MQSVKNLKRRSRLAIVEMKVETIGQAVAQIIKALQPEDPTTLIKVPSLRDREKIKMP